MNKNWFRHKKKQYQYKKLMTKAKNKEERTHGKIYNIIMGVLIFFSFFFLFNYPNPVIAILSGIFAILLTIVFVENMSYQLYTSKNHSGQPISKKTIVFLIAVKQIFLTYFFGVITFSLAYFFFAILPFQLGEKTAFNVFIIFTLLISFLIYYFYTKYEIGHKIFLKTALKEKRMIEAIKEEEYQERLLIMTDVFAICATVLLLANSTASLAYPAEVTPPDELLSTFEFKILMALLAVYVPAIYLRIIKL